MSETMSVRVKSCMGEAFNIEGVDKTVSSENLRELIAERFKISPQAMELTSKGFSTDSNDGIAAVRSGCTVNVFPKSRTGLDTVSNLSSSIPRKLKPEELLEVLSAMGEENGNEGVKAKVSIVVSSDEGNEAQVDLDLADAAKLFKMHGAKKGKNKSHSAEKDFMNVLQKLMPHEEKSDASAATSQISAQERKQRFHEECMKKGKEINERKMDNIRIQRKMDMLRQKREAKKARLTRLHRLADKKDNGENGSLNKSKSSTSTGNKAKMLNRESKSLSEVPCRNLSGGNAGKSPARKSIGFGGMQRGFLC